MANQSEKQQITEELFRRLREQPPESFKDLTLPLTKDTLSRQEFGVAMSNKWLSYKDKRYYFTSVLSDAVKGARTREHSEPAKKESPKEIVNNHTVPCLGELATVAQGASQLRILEVIYRGRNRLGHPNLLLLGETGTNAMLRVERGIPLSIANAMVSDPNKFNGRVISIDAKNNFVGIVLAQVKKEIPKTHVENQPETVDSVDI